MFIRADVELAHPGADDQLIRLTTDPHHAIDYLPVEGDWRPDAFGGRGPNDLWFVMTHTRARSTAPVRVYRRDADRWVLQDNRVGLLRRSYTAFIPWRDRVLGLRSYIVDAALAEVDEAGWRIPLHLRRSVETQLAASPGFDILGPRPSPAPMRLHDFILRVVAAPTGELLALPQPSKSSTPYVLRWGLTGAAATHGVRDPLPVGTVWTALAVRAADDAYVGGASFGEDASALLRRFDGETWSDQPAPPGIAIHDLSVTPDGDLWAIAQTRSDRTLWRRQAHDAAWQHIELPDVQFPDPPVPDWTCDVAEGCIRSDGDVGLITRPEHAPPEHPGQWWSVGMDRVVARAATDVWLLGSTGLERGQHDTITLRHVVLRTRSVIAPLRLPSAGDLFHEDVQGDDWHPRVGCYGNPVFIALHTLPADAPLTGPDPLVESFVRSNPALLSSIHAIHDELRGERRIVGLIVQLSDLTTGQALLAAAARINPDQPRSLECHLSDRIVRRFDPRTGAPLPDWISAADDR